MRIFQLKKFLQKRREGNPFTRILIFSYHPDVLHIFFVPFFIAIFFVGCLFEQAVYDPHFPLFPFTLFSILYFHLVDAFFLIPFGHIVFLNE